MHLFVNNVVLKSPFQQLSQEGVNNFQRGEIQLHLYQHGYSKNRVLGQNLNCVLETFNFVLVFIPI